MNLKIALICLLVLLKFNVLCAQDMDDGPKGQRPPGQRAGILIKGNVIDEQTKKPFEYATVSVLDQDGKIVTGTITAPDGSFKINAHAQKVSIKITFMGYDPIVINDVEAKDGLIDLKDQVLKVDTKTLNEVVVAGQKSTMEFKMDKKVFNVGQDLSSAGGSALDVLNNVPSVDVNLEGTISLRGNSNVQMLLNGKPSVMTKKNSLGTLTADMIEKIEVVTNPGAKHDAEGTTGIINIILKKDERKGLNGAFSLNTGVPNNHSVGLSMNKRGQKFNVFTQMGVGYRTYETTQYSENANYNDITSGSLTTNNQTEKNEAFYNFILGSDYSINEYNMLTLTGHYGYEVETHESDIDYLNTTVLTDYTQYHYTRLETADATNPKYEYDLDYVKEFKDHKDHILTASAKGSHFGKLKESKYVNTVLDGTVNVQNDQKSISDFNESKYVFRTDYVHPFTDKIVLEAGAKYQINDLENDQSLYDVIDGQSYKNDDLSPNVIFMQKIGAAYTTFSHEFNKFGYKLGLRLEHTQADIEVNDENVNIKDHLGLFPSAHMSYKFSEGFSIQTGYSRRLHRPHIMEYTPNTNYTDLNNIRTGNPNIKPSFTNAFEITAIRIFKLGSLNSSVFYHATDDVINNVITIDNGVTTTTPMNVGKAKSLGIELNGKLDLKRWYTTMFDLNYTQSNRTGTYESQSFDFNNDSWSARWTNRLKLPYNFDVECRLNYRSKSKSLQTITKAMTYANLGIRKKILKNRGVLNLSVQDLFNSSKNISYTDPSATFYQYSEHRRDKQRIILGFSYSFGKGEAMEFSGQKMF